MGIQGGPKIKNDNLVCLLDVDDKNSYPVTESTAFYDLSGNDNDGTLIISGTVDITSDLEAHWNFDTTGSGDPGDEHLIDLSEGGHSGSFANDTFISNDGIIGKQS